MKHHFFPPTPLKMAALELEEAKRLLLKHSALAEEYDVGAAASRAAVSAMEGRITRLKATIEGLKNELPKGVDG